MQLRRGPVCSRANTNDWLYKSLSIGSRRGATQCSSSGNSSNAQCEQLHMHRYLLHTGCQARMRDQTPLSAAASVKVVQKVAIKDLQIPSRAQTALPELNKPGEIRGLQLPQKQRHQGDERQDSSNGPALSLANR